MTPGLPLEAFAETPRERRLLRRLGVVGAVLLVGLGIGWRASVWAIGQVRDVAHTEAVAVVAADREQFKKDAENAARQGAEKAVRESVLPVMLEVAKHVSQDEQAQRDTDRRLDSIERGRR